MAYHPGGSFELFITAIDPKGKSESIRKFTLVREYLGYPSVIFVSMPLELKITTPGEWRISVSSSQMELANIPIKVISKKSTVDTSNDDSADEKKTRS